MPSFIQIPGQLKADAASVSAKEADDIRRFHGGAPRIHSVSLMCRAKM
jgi:hypothetical protein